MSLHVAKAQNLSLSKGGHAGKPDNWNLWNFSKRELVEIALHLASVCADCDGSEEALEGTAAHRRVLEEHAALKAAGII